MKKLNIIYKYVKSVINRICITSILCAFLFISCESFLEIDAPQSEIVGDVVFEDTSTVTAAISEIYAKLREDSILDGFGISYDMALYADELDYYGNQVSNFYLNSILPSSFETSNYWNSGFNLIYQANNIIEGIENSNSLSQEFKNQIIGEALFLRACIHFYLTNLYGDIPYITTSDYRINTMVSRTSTQEVYNKLIDDLIRAKDLLSDTYPTSEKIRANRGIVSALLARAYLYTEQWNNAIIESTSIINNTSTYSFENDLNKVFLKESSSAIWQLKPARDGENAGEADVFLIYGTPDKGALTNNIINDFESNDQRFIKWTGTATDGTSTWYFPFKYKVRITNTTLEYSVVFRLAEQYLIRAEARTQEGNLLGAQQDLNLIRTRAGLPNTSAVTFNDLLEAILKERRIELFTEFGHRFFDLKRLGKADAVLDAIKPGWDSRDLLLPVPETELLVNPNLLPQNFGY